MKWKEFEPQFNDAMGKIENVLDRTVKICEHFEGLMKEAELLQNLEQTFAVEAPQNLQILDQLTEIEDRENIPITAMFKAAEAFLRANYIVMIFTKIGALQGSINTKEEEARMPSIPKEMLH